MATLTQRHFARRRGKIGQIPAGADAHKIIDEIKNKFGKEIPRESMSPQLSRLKMEGIIKLEDRFWSLTDQAQKKTALGGAVGDEGYDLV